MLFHRDFDGIQWFMVELGLTFKTLRTLNHAIPIEMTRAIIVIVISAIHSFIYSEFVLFNISDELSFF